MADVTEPAARVVVVAGGTGLVGSAVVERLVADGHRVVVPSRRDDAEVPEGARLVPGVDWADPIALVEALREPGWEPTAAVAALGGWWLGPQLVDVLPETWDRILAANLTAHWHAVRALAPLLGGADPAYLLLNGAAATEPMPGSGPVNVAGAGQRMLVRVLREEPIGARVRFGEVSVLAAVSGDERNLDPDAEVERGAVADAVARTLADPRAPAVVEVS